MANHHTLGGFKQWKRILSQLWRPRVWNHGVGVSRAVLPLRPRDSLLRASFLICLWLRPSLAFLVSWTHGCSLCLLLYTAFSLCVCPKCPLPLLQGTCGCIESSPGQPGMSTSSHHPQLSPTFIRTLPTRKVTAQVRTWTYLFGSHHLAQHTFCVSCLWKPTVYPPPWASYSAVGNVSQVCTQRFGKKLLYKDILEKLLTRVTTGEHSRYPATGKYAEGITMRPMLRTMLQTQHETRCYRYNMRHYITDALKCSLFSKKPQS